MKKIKTALLAAILIAFAASASAQTTIPALVNFQGRLTASGANVTAPLRMEFNIYDAAENGTLLYGPQVFENVTVIGGRFNVLLGPADATARNLATALEGGSAFVAVKVAASGASFGAEMTPRQQFLSVPFALRTVSSESADIGDALDQISARLDALEGQVEPGVGPTLSDLKALVAHLKKKYAAPQSATGDQPQPGGQP
jgi:hypothetical protein